MSKRVLTKCIPRTDGGTNLPKSFAKDLRKIDRERSYLRIQPVLSGANTPRLTTHQHGKRSCRLDCGRILGLRHNHGKSRWYREKGRWTSYSPPLAGLVGEMFTVCYTQVRDPIVVRNMVSRSK